MRQCGRLPGKLLHGHVVGVHASKVLLLSWPRLQAKEWEEGDGGGLRRNAKKDRIIHQLTTVRLPQSYISASLPSCLWLHAQRFIST